VKNNWLSRIAIPCTTLLIACALLLSACAPAQPAATPTADLNLVATIVQQTMSAADTLEAKNPTLTSTPLPPTSTPLPPPPSATPQPSPTNAPSAPGYILCDSFDFLGDVNVPDNTIIPPGSTVKKMWAIKNTGVCTWDNSYKAVFFSGDTIGSSGSVAISGPVAPGGMTLVSVEFKVPDDLDKEFVSFWKLSDPAGNLFGWGAQHDQPFWIKIKTGESYSFLNNPCSARWQNNTDLLFCPPKKGDSKGYFYRQDAPTIETGKARAESALIMSPQKGDGGVIRAIFNPIKVPDGFLRTDVGCMYKNTTCRAKVGLSYSIDGGAEKNYDEWSETYDGLYTTIEINLRDLGLVGKQVSFIFYVTSENDQQFEVFWLNPSIGP
jgi:hypothetical protein